MDNDMTKIWWFGKCISVSSFKIMAMFWYLTFEISGVYSIYIFISVDLLWESEREQHQLP